MVSGTPGILLPLLESHVPTILNPGCDFWIEYIVFRKLTSSEASARPSRSMSCIESQLNILI